MFTINQPVTVHTMTASAHDYARRQGIEGMRVPAVVTAVHEDGGYANVTYPDGTTGSPLLTDMEDATPPGAIVAIELAREDNSATPLETPANAPLADWEADLMGVAREQPANEPPAPVDPLDAWEAGLPDVPGVLAAMWADADAAADAKGACGEYEATAARPHGHEGRPAHHHYEGEYGEPMGAGTVTFRRTVYRTVSVVQETTVSVDAGEDAYDALDNVWDWDDIDTYDDGADEQVSDDGPEVYDTYRESTPELGEPTQPADLVRAALESGTEWHAIKDALLLAAQRHGAPIEATRTADVAADVSRYVDGAWSAPTREAHRGLPIGTYEWTAIESGASSEAAYAAARQLIGNLTPADAYPRLAYPTLTAIIRREWSVNA